MSLITAIRGHLAGRMLIFLGASVLQVVLAVVLLPLTTVALTAADFGYFALFMSVAAFASAVGDGGGGLALPAHYGVESRDERRRMLASFFLVSLCLSMALAIIFVILSPSLAAFITDADAEKFSWRIVYVTAMIIPLRSFSTLATSVFSVSGRGNAIAAQIAAQALATFVGTLICLFGLKWGTTSLFAGALAGQLAALAISAIALGSQPWIAPSPRWLKVVGNHASIAALAGVTDGARGIGENSLIASHLNISAVGIFSHARLYYGMLMSATNAVSHNVWSISLAEAREQSRAFAKTVSIWTLIHICLTIFGVGFVCVGNEFVAALTHDRLTKAAQLVPWFVVLLLIHVSGRAQAAMVYAHGGAVSVNRTRAMISLSVLVSLPFVIGNIRGFGLNFGLAGAVAILIVEAVLFRAYLRWKSMRFGGPLKFQDGWAFGGAFAIVSTWLMSTEFALTLPMRGAVFCAVTVGVVALEKKRIAGLLKSVQDIYKIANP